jgi:uncharacterized protein YbaP (TraB family)
MNIRARANPIMPSVTWYFDFISPYAYLGLHALNRLPAGTDLNYQPIRTMRTPAILFIGASLLAGCLVPRACPAEQAPPQQMDELVVTGERTGPGMWHAHRGASQLWILGSITPLPKGITWRSKQVEQVLDSTNLVLVPKPLEIGIVRILWLLITERKVLMVHGGKRLKDVLPANLYARFALQRARYTNDSDKWERFRPIIASAFLQQAAFHQVGLSARIDLGVAVRGLARKHHVRVEEVNIAGVGDVLEALKTMQPATETKCVEASLVTVESGLPRLLDRAQAWATGNVERIEKLPEPAEVDSCIAALDSGAAKGDLVARVRRAWLEAMDRALQSGTVTLAVVNMDMLLGTSGLLENLRAKGYEVDSP